MDKELLKHELKRHVSDSSAIVTLANPVYAGLETMVADMSDKVSINSRLINMCLVYAGLGSLTKIRDFSKKVFKVGKESKEYVKGLHDIVFAGIFIVGLKPLVYLASGEAEWKKIVLATGLSVLAGAAIAYPAGYLVDSYRELTGVEEYGRLPDIIKRQDPRFKKTLAALLTAGSVGAAALIYAFNGK